MVELRHGGDPLTPGVSTDGAEPLTAMSTPAVLIRLRSRWIPLREEVELGYFRDGKGSPTTTSPTALYDAARAWWRIRPERVEARGVDYAVPVVDGVTRALYTIDRWIGPRHDGRYAFTGRKVTDGEVFDDYVGPFGKWVPFPPHSQNPIYYWPPRPRRG